MFKTITLLLLFITSTATFANDSESGSNSASNSESSEIKEPNVSNEPGSSQNPSQTETTDSEKDKVSGCSDPDLEMLGLDYMCK